MERTRRARRTDWPGPRPRPTAQVSLSVDAELIDLVGVAGQQNAMSTIDGAVVYVRFNSIEFSSAIEPCTIYYVHSTSLSLASVQLEILRLRSLMSCRHCSLTTTLLSSLLPVWLTAEADGGASIVGGARPRFGHVRVDPGWMDDGRPAFQPAILMATSFFGQLQGWPKLNFSA